VLYLKVKIQFALEQATKAQRGSRGMSTPSLTSALYGVGGIRHASAALPPGNTRYPLYRRLSGPQDRSGRVRKISASDQDSFPGHIDVFNYIISRYCECIAQYYFWTCRCRVYGDTSQVTFLSGVS
jgi:hypothetical protein